MCFPYWTGHFHTSNWPFLATPLTAQQAEATTTTNTALSRAKEPPKEAGTAAGLDPPNYYIYYETYYILLYYIILYYIVYYYIYILYYIILCYIILYCILLYILYHFVYCIIYYIILFYIILLYNGFIVYNIMFLFNNYFFDLICYNSFTCILYIILVLHLITMKHQIGQWMTIQIGKQTVNSCLWWVDLIFWGINSQIYSNIRSLLITNRDFTRPGAWHGEES